MKPIDSLPNLIKILSEEEDDDYKQIVQEIQIPFSELEPHTQWDSNFYTRTCLVRTEKYELLLLCWEPGQFTPIHNHNNQECWIYIAQGELKEHRFQIGNQEIPKQINIEILKKKNLYHTNDEIGFHRLSNTSKNRSVSLHLYAKPIDKCRYYSEESKSLKTKILSYSNLKKTV